MAGGSKRGSIFRQTCAGNPPPAAPPPMPDIKHCWVTTPQGRVPGLLTRWTRDVVDGTWLGIVVLPVLGDDQHWRLLETEVLADNLEPA